MANDPHVQVEFASSEIDVIRAIELPSIGCGGECVFVGRTRPEIHPQHGALIALHYDCYEDMAQTEIETIALEAIEQFSVQLVRVTHTIGKVPVNGASVVIAVGSHHRDEAFQACRRLIDNLKSRVPIWKQEEWADGATWVEGNRLVATSA